MQLVSVSAFPKSGVTYLSSLLFYTLFDNGDPADIEKKYVVDIHIHDLSAACAYADHAFYKNHHAFSLDNKYCVGAKKALYLIRDPIDIMRSAYDYLSLIGGKPEDLTLEAFTREWISNGGDHFQVAGPWALHVRSWLEQKERPTHLVRYQDLVDDPVTQLDAIFAFLDLDPPRSAIDRGVLNSTMTAMRAREEAEFRAKQPGVFYSAGVDDGMSEGARFINKGYRLSYDHLEDAEKRLADEQFGALCARFLA